MSIQRRGKKGRIAGHYRAVHGIMGCYEKASVQELQREENRKDVEDVCWLLWLPAFEAEWQLDMEHSMPVPANEGTSPVLFA
eukprot:535866-Pelagomonas_calceolata.AAC.1